MRSLILLAFIAAVLTSCGPSEVFTENSRIILEGQGIDIEEIQFYADKEIIMQREISKTETSIAKGEIIMKEGQRTQEIRIPRGTPGVVEQSADGKLWVAFEDCEECTLRFIKNSYESYQVDADKWLQGKGQINYRKKSFYLIPPHNDALLMVKKSDIYKPEKRSRTLKGVKVEDRKNSKKNRKDRIRRKDLKEVTPDAPEENDEQLWEDEDDGTTNQ